MSAVPVNSSRVKCICVRFDCFKFQFHKHNFQIFNCNIFEEGGVVSISKSRFKNLVANKTAWAVAVNGISVLELSDCEFDNVSSANNGGAIFVDCNANGNVLVSSLVNNTNFTNCSSDFGGAILQLNGHLIIISSIFHSNSATYEGGAVYTSFADLFILNSKFISNNVEDGISYGGHVILTMPMQKSMGVIL